METRIVNKWMMCDSSVHVVISIYSKAGVRSEHWIGGHRLEEAFKETPWMMRDGNHSWAKLINISKRLDGTYEATLPGMKPSQLYAFRQYMASICKKLVASGDWNIDRIVFHLDIRTGSMSISAEG